MLLHIIQSTYYHYVTSNKRFLDISKLSTFVHCQWPAKRVSFPNIVHSSTVHTYVCTHLLNYYSYLTALTAGVSWCYLCSPAVRITCCGFPLNYACYSTGRPPGPFNCRVAKESVSRFAFPFRWKRSNICTYIQVINGSIDGECVEIIKFIVV